MGDHNDGSCLTQTPSHSAAGTVGSTVKKIKRPTWFFVAIPGKNVWQDKAPAPEAESEKIETVATETFFDKIPCPDPVIQRRYLID